MIPVYEFIDDCTISFTGFSDFLKEFTPNSEYGKRLAKQLSAYLPEDRQELHNHHQRIKIVLELMKHNPAIVARIKNRLRRLPQLADVWALTFTQSEFALLSSFRASQHHICKALIKEGKLSGWLQLLDNDELGKGVFSDQVSGEFYLEDNASDDLYQIRQNIKQLQIKFDENQRTQIAAVADRYQLSNSIECWVIDRSQKNLTEKMLADDQLLLLEENITSLVFMLKDSEQTIKQKAKLKAMLETERRAEQQIYFKLEKKLREREQLYIAEQEKLGQLDLLFAFAELAKEQNAVCPEIYEQNTHEFKLDTVRHLILEKDVEQSKGHYQPLDIELKGKGAMLSGSNMGGKTVVLQTVGFFQALVQLGFFVPAAYAGTILYNKVCSLSQLTEQPGGLSGFGREINRLKQILPLRESGVLYLLDEPGRSTCISEGKALLLSIIEHIVKSPSLLLIASHLDDIENSKLEVLKMAGLKKELIEKNSDAGLNELMDYTVLKKDKAQGMSSDALDVALLLGLEAVIVDFARDLLLRGE